MFSSKLKMLAKYQSFSDVPRVDRHFPRPSMTIFGPFLNYFPLCMYYSYYVFVFVLGTIYIVPT